MAWAPGPIIRTYILTDQAPGSGRIAHAQLEPLLRKQLAAECLALLGKRRLFASCGIRRILVGRRRSVSPDALVLGAELALFAFVQTDLAETAGIIDLRRFRFVLGIRGADPVGFVSLTVDHARLLGEAQVRALSAQQAWALLLATVVNTGQIVTGTDSRRFRHHRTSRASHTPRCLPCTSYR